MKTNLEASGGLVMAEAVSFALAEKLGKMDAYHLVAELTQRAAKAKRPFKDILAEDEAIKAHMSAADIERVLKPNNYQGTAQTFIDRLVASAQGRTVRRVTSHITDPKMPSQKPGELSTIAASALIKPVDALAATAKPVEDPAVSTEKFGSAVAAASALIAQTISDLARPTTLPRADTFAPLATTPEPVAEQAVEQASSAPMVEPTAVATDPAPVTGATPPEQPEPAIATATVPQPTLAVNAEPAVEPNAPAAEPAPAADDPATEPAVVADAPALDQPGEEPGALLEVFARAENENAPASPQDKRKPA
jgi:hypothetical protein